MHVLLAIAVISFLLGALMIAFVILIEFSDRARPSRSPARQQRRADLWGGIVCSALAGLVAYAARDADSRHMVIAARGYGTWMSPTQAYAIAGILLIAALTCIAFYVRHRHEQ